MRLSKISFAIAVLAISGLAQSASDLESPNVLRVADQMRCSCGCNLTRACRMDGGCGMCTHAKEKIFAMQSNGKSDSQILDAFIQEEGRDVLAVRPGPMGVIGPWGALGLGAILVVFLIRRLSTHKPATAAASADAPAADSEELAKYREQIEKDMSKLE